MLVNKGSLAWIFEDDDWTTCGDTLASTDYPEEFTLSSCLSSSIVEGACLAGFMPMSARFIVPGSFPYGEMDTCGKNVPGGDEETRIFLTPKLHLKRCVLNPSEARIRSTSRRASRNFKISVNKAFDITLAACVDTHGDGWLTPPLTRVFKELHANRAQRPIQLSSVELWKDGALVAGEIGYAAGSAYASLSGFHTLSGAGTVQLGALAGILADFGYCVWDLGMPLAYKSELGGKTLSRHEYLPLFREAYRRAPVHSLGETLEPGPVRFP